MCERPIMQLRLTISAPTRLAYVLSLVSVADVSLDVSSLSLISYHHTVQATCWLLAWMQSIPQSRVVLFAAENDLLKSTRYTRGHHDQKPSNP